MAGKKITVVISQAPGRNPTKRNLEEELAAALLVESDVDVSLVPHLNDLTADHSGLLFLKGVPGDMVVLSWLFPRAARWILDRNGVKGQLGTSLLKPADEDEEAGTEAERAEESRPNAIGALNAPKRKIYCIDLRDQNDPRVVLDEIRRIAREATVQTVDLDLMSWIGGSPAPAQMQRYLNPFAPNGAPAVPANGHTPVAAPNGANRIHSSPFGLINGADLTGLPATPASGPAADDALRRRWYPIIDYSRCTNCMACIDFCLFGVYGVDAQDRILVEQQDNCKKGCPACSRVCPENAIIFPEHKTPAIAGADVERDANFKIDLSKLFGAPTAIEVAAAERDQELLNDGREAVGLSVGIPKRRTEQPQQRDQLDDLMDDLDKLGL
ncbi:MAG: ferredoxin family protein [Planctomycetaceae bacterium]|nr:MAG: ferredoxin family protein [Planctomycetaceae bacterium]